MRKIIHLDMDCFYAAVEMRERPELAGQPIAVGGGSRRGVVTTCNYEARKYGVHSAMPGFQARERCPHLVFLPCRFDLYRAESANIRAILREYTPLVEPLSLDEAYLDVTASGRYAWDIAKEIRARIFAETKLTGSAGIAPTKMLAKIASDWKKPNGQFAIRPEQVTDFLRDLPVRKIWGVGPKSAERFAQEGIRTCGDLQKLSLADLARRHGKWGQELYRLCRGDDDREVVPDRLRKSLSNERTYGENLTTLEACRAALHELVAELQAELRLKASDRIVRKAVVKVKFADFTRTTKECVHANPDLATYEMLLAEAWQRRHQPVRLLGAGVRFVSDDEEVPVGDDLQQELALELRGWQSESAKRGLLSLDPERSAASRRAIEGPLTIPAPDAENNQRSFDSGFAFAQEPFAHPRLQRSLTWRTLGPMNAYDLLLQRSREVAGYNSTASVLAWDQETYMPEKASAYRAEQLSQLAGLAHRLSTAPEIGDWLHSCEQEMPACVDDLECELRNANVREWRRDYDRATKLPARLVEDIAKTTSLAREHWAKARAASDFSAFAPWLEKILGLVREQADCWGYEGVRYDALLDAYEPGARVAHLAPLFDDLQARLAPLLPRLRAATSSADPARLEGSYPVAAQQRFNQRVAGSMGFDFEAGRIDATVHPFCTEMGPRDCRLTTRYNEKDFTSSLFGVMHEAGHGLYTQGLRPEQFGTPMGTFLSLGIHESQSRLWENQVGRSRDFWKHWYGEASAQFPRLGSLPLDEFWLIVNRVEPSYIRVEADEATYNLHIVLRFEMEQRLVSGELAVASLPEAWNERFEQLFQLPVPDDRRGCLQDTHWALGLFGYFPTYTLGTLNAAQLFDAALARVPGLADDLTAGKYARLLAWLREQVHTQGRRFSPGELMTRATGSPTKADAFMNYLQAKYGLR